MSSLRRHGIQGGDFAAPQPGVGSLEYQRHAVEAPIGHQPGEKRFADKSTAHRSVAVNL